MAAIEGRGHEHIERGGGRGRMRGRQERTQDAGRSDADVAALRKGPPRQRRAPAIANGFEYPEDGLMRAAVGGLRVRIGQPVEGATADDAEPRNCGFPLDLVAGAERVDERTDFCRRRGFDDHGRVEALGSRLQALGSSQTFDSRTRSSC